MSAVTWVRGSLLIEGCVLRTARKPWRCSGNGASALGPCREYACADRTIPVGSVHVEYVGESPAFTSGSRHCLDCAAAYYVDKSITGATP